MLKILDVSTKQIGVEHQIAVEPVGPHAELIGEGPFFLGGQIAGRTAIARQQSVELRDARLFAILHGGIAGHVAAEIVPHAELAGKDITFPRIGHGLVEERAESAQTNGLRCGDLSLLRRGQAVIGTAWRSRRGNTKILQCHRICERKLGRALSCCQLPR